MDEEQLVSLLRAYGSIESRSGLIEALTKLKSALTQAAAGGKRSGAGYRILETVVTTTKLSLLNLLTSDEQRRQFFGLFAAANCFDTTVVIWDHVTKVDSSMASNLLIVLHSLLKTKLAAVFIDFLDPCQRLYDADSSTLFRRAVASFPDKLSLLWRDARRTGAGLRAYFKAVAMAFVKSLSVGRQRLSQGKDTCLRFHSALLETLQLNGYFDMLLGELMPRLRPRVDADFVWRRVLERLFSAIAVPALEGVVLSLISAVGKPTALWKFFGNSFVENRQIRQLATFELLFNRYYSTCDVPECVIGYLSLQPQFRPLLIDVFADLVKVWSSPTFVMLLPSEQQYYLCQCLAICLRYLKPEDPGLSSVQEAVWASLLKGMETHLKVVQPGIHKWGMVIGEAISNLISVQSSELKFDYEEDRETLALKALMKNGETDMSDLATGAAIFSMLGEGDELEESLPIGTLTTETMPDVIDSDDDLVPFDMPNDEDRQRIDAATSWQLHYVRNCMALLYDASDRDVYDAAFHSLDGLIRGNSPGFEDACADLVHTLIHLEDRFALDDFSAVRRCCLISCLAVNPLETCACLAQHLCKNNLAIEQRLLILDVFNDAAKEMYRSGRLTTGVDGQTAVQETLSDEVVAPSPSLPTWRKILKTRIETKTRRWTRRRVEPEPLPSLFAPYCLQFFDAVFSLTSAKLSTLDLFGRDYFVLGRLLYTAANIAQWSEHTLHSRSIATRLYCFVERLFDHEQSFVRLAVMYTLSVLVSVMPYDTFLDHRQQLRERISARQEHESDRECRQLLSTLRFAVHNRYSECFREFSQEVLFRLPAVSLSAALGQ